MKIIRHRWYLSEIITALWFSVIFLLLGSTTLDGGWIVSFALITVLSFWVGSIRPLLRKKELKSDRLYLRYGFFGVLLVTIILAPVVWMYRS